MTTSGDAFGRSRSSANRKLVELFWWPAAKSTVIVVKDFDDPIKDGKPWPQMVGCEVYAPITTSNRWDDIKLEIAAIHQRSLVKVTLTENT